MTASDIREQAIEVLARAWYEPDYGKWEAVDETVRINWRNSMTRLVDAFAEAGLLPTEVEEHTSRTWGQAEPVSRRRRYVTEWRGVQR